MSDSLSRVQDSETEHSTKIIKVAFSVIIKNLEFPLKARRTNTLIRLNSYLTQDNNTNPKQNPIP